MVKLTRGERFKQIREERGFKTQQEVLDACGVQKSMLSALENDESCRDVGFSHIVKLSELYGVSLDWLFGRSETRSPEADMQAAQLVTGLSEKAISQIKFDCEHVYCDGKRYLAFLSELLIDPCFRHLLHELYNLATANEGERIYLETVKSFDERASQDKMIDHSEFTKDVINFTKRSDIHEEVKGYFVLQHNLDKCDSLFALNLTKDVHQISIGEVKRFAAMQAFERLINEESGSTCLRKFDTHENIKA